MKLGGKVSVFRRAKLTPLADFGIGRPLRSAVSLLDHKRYSQPRLSFETTFP
jgi:hypothetical protein